MPEDKKTKAWQNNVGAYPKGKVVRKVEPIVKKTPVEHIDNNYEDIYEDKITVKPKPVIGQEHILLEYIKTYEHKKNTDFSGKYKGEPDLYEVKLLIKNGADMDAIDENGYTALIYACRYKYIETVKELINNLADINIQNQNGTTALMISADQGDIKIARLLIEAKADVNLKNKNNKTALMFTATVPHTSFIEFTDLLIRNSADVNAVDNHGSTALHYASESKCMEITKLLILAEAKLDVQDCDGNTPLILAIKKQDVEVVRFLIKSGANTDIPGEQGRTALVWATIIGNADAVSLLLADKADTEIEDDENKIALMYAKELEKEAIENIKKPPSTPVNTSGDFDNSDKPLLATKAKRQKIVQLLTDAFYTF